MAPSPREVPLRFCMITTFYPPFHFGGDAIAIQRLSRGLARRGHHVEVIADTDAWRALADGPAPEDPPDPHGVVVHRLSSRLGVLSELLTHQLGRPVVHRRRIRQIVDEGDFDVVNFHNVSLVGGPGLFSLGNPEAVRLYMAHEHWLVCPTHVLWRHGRERCDERECMRCLAHYGRPPQLWREGGVVTRGLDPVDRFLAISEFSRRKHREFGFPREMEVLPYGLPEREDAEATEGAPPQERPYFLFVGRLEDIKGLDEVIPAMASYPQADLVIAGTGGREAHLRTLAADLPNVRFLGWVDSGALRSWYRHCLALVVPSLCYETFGIIVAEAFRDGTPVIARDVGPLPELVRAADGGVLFHDAAGLVAAMARLQGDPAERARMGASARKAFTERWSEDVVVPRYLEIVEEVRRGRSTQRAS